MSLSNAAEQALLDHIFRNQAWANVGDAAGLLPSAAAGNLYVALHSTTDPGEAGDQSTNEVAYTGYARQPISRSTGFTVSAAGATNAAPVTFPLCSGGSATARYFSVGTVVSGAGQIIVSGQLNADLAISTGIQPIIPTGDLDIVAD